MTFNYIFWAIAAYYTDFGREAVETMTAVGPGLTGRSVGDVVAYGGNPMGSYTEEQILPAGAVVSVPSSIDPIVGLHVAKGNDSLVLTSPMLQELQCLKESIKKIEAKYIKKAQPDLRVFFPNCFREQLGAYCDAEPLVSSFSGWCRCPYYEVDFFEW
ncbi:hypothetical protein IFM89_020554 [Coptis chinensis]|uniref:Uncharacterized protein n=1 Tax=Coptis chinensis TaxID=261450 RepID=A0A835HE58_9MAGN|nr:hypothetical protein IFM89_020554 [Coptis chinensis]